MKYLEHLVRRENYVIIRGLMKQLSKERAGCIFHLGDLASDFQGPWICVVCLHSLLLAKGVEWELFQEDFVQGRLELLLGVLDEGWRERFHLSCILHSSLSTAMWGSWGLLSRGNPFCGYREGVHPWQAASVISHRGSQSGHWGPSRDSATCGLLHSSLLKKLGHSQFHTNLEGLSELCVTRERDSLGHPRTVKAFYGLMWPCLF